MMKKNNVLVFLVFAFCSGVVSALEIPKGVREALLVFPDGYKINAELALTAQEQEKGLMFRKELKENRGMLFVFPEVKKRFFWMKNTFIELDIVFIDKDLRINKIFHRVPPAVIGQRDAEVANASATAQYVLELSGGAARKHRLKSGTLLKVVFTANKSAAAR